MKTEEERPLTAAEVATRMGVKVSLVLAWIASHQLRAVNIGSDAGPGHRPRWRILPADLATFIDDRSNALRPAPVDRPGRKLPPRKKTGGEEFV